ncbi:hypothetical protein PFISCL1PPCAC_22081 [Pristionchus fissidentatus]|uniref:G protein-coupled receptor n=1 Tax=Pristionchus fissidentatus TaxID=1538716 RepID=A0AAV5WFG6_9BILA|nr:hypothetical protein PFISCL1PPCAC_22081 [Pristionchus fissidentatus]
MFSFLGRITIVIYRIIIDFLLSESCPLNLGRFLHNAISAFRLFRSLTSLNCLLYEGRAFLRYLEFFTTHRFCLIRIELSLSPLVLFRVLMLHLKILVLTRSFMLFLTKI